MEALIHLRQSYTDVLIRICPLLRRSGNKSEIFSFPRAKRISLVPQERISLKKDDCSRNRLFSCGHSTEMQRPFQ